MKVVGGVKDYRIEEQLAVVKKMNAFPSGGIVILESMPNIVKGETYLFALGQGKTEIYLNMTPQQSIFSLNDPFKRQGFNEHTNSSRYYSETVDEYGSPLISAKDVISVFGKDKWEAFWNDWQKQNPDWETWLDREAVERALQD